MHVIFAWACAPEERPPDLGDPLASSAEGSSPLPEETDPETSDPPPETGSRCTVGAQALVCTHETTTLLTGFTGLLPREVHWQVPLGEAPASGWPAAILFQGSFFTAETFWTVLDLDLFGYDNQGLLTKRLLDSGFAVLTPEAHAGGSTAWDTNIPPMSVLWELSEDHQFMLDIFDAISGGTFGDIDEARLYAAGISSGGYMTSRMDLAYRPHFRALAVHSASYATCAGPLCVIPDDLSEDHLPTLFLHGGADPIVPVETMERYRDALVERGVETNAIIDPEAAHAWIDAAPAEIVAWFEVH